MTRTITYLLFFFFLGLGTYLYIPLTKEPVKAQEFERPVFGGSYKRGIPTRPDTLDPVYCSDVTSSEVIGQIYSRLLRLGSNLKLKPDLAERYEVSEDRKVYTFTLKRKVRFHTITEENLISQNKGREVTAGDVVFSFQRVLDPRIDSPNRHFLEMVEGAQEFMNSKRNFVSGFKVLSDHKLQIRLRSPFSPFLYTLATHALSIVPQEDVSKWGDSFGEHPVGSGAFIFEKVESWKHKDSRVKGKMTLRSNLDFHKGRPYLDKVEFYFIPKDRNQFSLFEKHNLYHVGSIPPEHLRDALKNKDYHFQESASKEISYLGMNVKIKPFDNVFVRKALNHLVNKDMIVRHILSNRGGVANGPLSPGIVGYDPGRLMGYDYNIAKAREYLARANYSFSENGMVKDFPEITLHLNQREVFNAIAKVVQANFADIGIKLRLIIDNWGNHIHKIDHDQAPFFGLGWQADYPDADNILFNNFHSSSKIYNSSRYLNPVVDRTLEEARKAQDEEKRVALYRQAESIIIDEAPWIFLHYPTSYTLSQPYVRGLKINALGPAEVDYYHVWLSANRNLEDDKT